MKKLILMCMAVLALCSCSNDAVKVNDQAYTKVHILAKLKCYPIKNIWNIDEIRSEIEITDYGRIVIPKTEYVLVKGKCPYCNSYYM